MAQAGDGRWTRQKKEWRAGVKKDGCDPDSVWET